MILKNNVARLITINGPLKDSQRLKAYQIRPGNNPSVDVPDELCNNKFVKGLIESGALTKVGESTDESEPSQYDEMSKTDLTSFAETMGIEVKSAWSKAQIIAEIEKSEAA